ncbi:hypothetical protein OROGR_017137 [Orobanche gracilis]
MGLRTPNQVLRNPFPLVARNRSIPLTHLSRQKPIDSLTHLSPHPFIAIEGSPLQALFIFFPESQFLAGSANLGQATTQ